tara:strand:- start:695 stop:1072 length:378 start_codon:yes stop_codon:yes gene_type:complete
MIDPRRVISVTFSASAAVFVRRRCQADFPTILIMPIAPTDLEMTDRAIVCQGITGLESTDRATTDRATIAPATIAPATIGLESTDPATIDRVTTDPELTDLATIDRVMTDRSSIGPITDLSISAI